jgi:hypothetical protein
MSFLSFPSPNKKAIVKNNTDIAHGLILSANAARIIVGANKSIIIERILPLFGIS